MNIRTRVYAGLWLIAAVVAGAKARGSQSFCDLFAGVGNFALPLARSGLSGVMVKRTPSAVKAAKDFVWNAIDGARALTVGKGSGPVDHMHGIRRT